ncbi:GntR family transcriptional regulator [Brachybacterium sp. DNPG3]
MSDIVVDLEDPTPPFEQVRRAIADRILSGALREGDRLPSIRALARDLGLAPGTVARAVKLLEEADLVVTRRGAGTRVAPGAGSGIEATAGAETDADQGDAVPSTELLEMMIDAVTAARELGYGDAEIGAAARAALHRRPTATGR